MRQAIQAIVGYAAGLRRYFPERQIYLRSNGEVRYLAVSTHVQVLGATVACVALGWVALTTINFLARDAVLEAREAEIRDLENARLAQDADMDMLKRDILDRAERLEERQRYLGEIIGDEAPNGEGATTTAKTVPPAETQNDKSQKGAFLDLGINPVYASFSPNFTARRIVSTQDQDEGYGLFAKLSGRLDQVQNQQDSAAQILAERARDRIASVGTKLSKTGISTDRLLDKWQPAAASGGPYFAAEPLPEFIGDARDAASAGIFETLENDWIRLNKLNEAVTHFPAIIPADDYYVSSHFGRRTDPYTKVRAIHYGLDMAGWPGTKVRNAAPGRVVKAGRWGPYGQMIEIDHGNGFRTRYGHMRKLNVKKGDVLDAGQAIGEMGCSGRCTSTHLHYEVWFDGKPLNPQAFLEVSEDVLKIQRGIE